MLHIGEVCYGVPEEDCILYAIRIVQYPFCLHISMRYGSHPDEQARMDKA